MMADDGRGNLAIRKLLALKKLYIPFLRSTYSEMSRLTFLGGDGAVRTSY